MVIAPRRISKTVSNRLVSVSKDPTVSEPETVAPKVMKVKPKIKPKVTAEPTPKPIEPTTTTVRTAQGLNLNQYINNPSYEVDFTEGGKVKSIRSKPVEYKYYKKPQGQRDPTKLWETKTYVPLVIEFKDGRPVKQIKKDVRTTLRDKDFGVRREPFVKAETVWTPEGLLKEQKVYKALNVPGGTEVELQSKKTYDDGQLALKQKTQFARTGQLEELYTLDVSKGIERTLVKTTEKEIKPTTKTPKSVTVLETPTGAQKQIITEYKEGGKQIISKGKIVDIGPEGKRTVRKVKPTETRMYIEQVAVPVKELVKERGEFLKDVRQQTKEAARQGKIIQMSEDPLVKREQEMGLQEYVKGIVKQKFAKVPLAPKKEKEPVMVPVFDAQATLDKVTLKKVKDSELMVTKIAPDLYLTESEQLKEARKQQFISRMEDIGIKTAETEKKLTKVSTMTGKILEFIQPIPFLKEPIRKTAEFLVGGTLVGTYSGLKGIQAGVQATTYQVMFKEPLPQVKKPEEVLKEYGTFPRAVKTTAKQIVKPITYGAYKTTEFLSQFPGIDVGIDKPPAKPTFEDFLVTGAVVLGGVSQAKAQPVTFKPESKALPKKFTVPEITAKEAQQIKGLIKVEFDQKVTVKQPLPLIKQRELIDVPKKLKIELAGKVQKKPYQEIFEYDYLEGVSRRQVNIGKRRVILTKPKETNVVTIEAFKEPLFGKTYKKIGERKVVIDKTTTKDLLSQIDLKKLTEGVVVKERQIKTETVSPKLVTEYKEARTVTGVRTFDKPVVSLKGGKVAADIRIKDVAVDVETIRLDPVTKKERGIILREGVPKRIAEKTGRVDVLGAQPFKFGKEFQAPTKKVVSSKRVKAVDIETQVTDVLAGIEYKAPGLTQRTIQQQRVFTGEFGFEPLTKPKPVPGIKPLKKKSTNVKTVKQPKASEQIIFDLIETKPRTKTKKVKTKKQEMVQEVVSEVEPFVLKRQRLQKQPVYSEGMGDLMGFSPKARSNVRMFVTQRQPQIADRVVRGNGIQPAIRNEFIETQYQPTKIKGSIQQRFRLGKPVRFDVRKRIKTLPDTRYDTTTLIKTELGTMSEVALKQKQATKFRQKQLAKTMTEQKYRPGQFRFEFEIPKPTKRVPPPVAPPLLYKKIKKRKLRKKSMFEGYKERIFKILKLV